MLEVAELAKVVTSHSGPSPRGISCKFIQIDDNWGIKVYHNRGERNKAHRRQSEMAVYGYAPAVGAMFEVGEKYCYVTEMAQTFVDTNLQDEEWDDACEEVRMKYPSMDDDIEELCSDMKSVGFEFYDVHYGNFAFLRGKLVCIDFGN